MARRTAKCSMRSLIRGCSASSTCSVVGFLAGVFGCDRAAGGSPEILFERFMIGFSFGLLTVVTLTSWPASGRESRRGSGAACRTHRGSARHPESIPDPSRPRNAERVTDTLWSGHPQPCLNYSRGSDAENQRDLFGRWSWLFAAVAGWRPAPSRIL